MLYDLHLGLSMSYASLQGEKERNGEASRREGIGSTKSTRPHAEFSLWSTRPEPVEVSAGVSSPAPVQRKPFVDPQ